MIRISKLSDYATLILSYLALEPTVVKSAAQMAKALHLQTPTVSKILKILSEAELLHSTRGTGGGYSLAKEAKKISLLEIVSAIEGKLAMTECCQTETLCNLETLCSMKDNWQVINRIIVKALADFSLEEMMQPMVNNQKTLKGIPIVSAMR